MEAQKGKFGHLIVSLRKMRHLERKELAAKIDISYAYLANFENGQRILPSNLASRFERVLEIPKDSLVSISRVLEMRDNTPEAIQLFDEMMASSMRTFTIYFQSEGTKRDWEIYKAKTEKYNPNSLEDSNAERTLKELLRIAEKLDNRNLKLLVQISKTIASINDSP